MIDVYGRWNSSNLGDRWQGPAVAPILAAAGLEWRAFTYRGRTQTLERPGLGAFDVLDPRKRKRSSRTALALTGSLSVGSDSTATLRALVGGTGPDELERLVIWGGIQDAYLLRSDHARGAWAWLGDERVTVLVRSCWERWVLQRLAGRGSRSRMIVGGDPMALWCSEHGDPLGVKGGPTVAVVSRYCLERHPARWERELRRCARVGVLAMTTDGRIIAERGYTAIRTPEDFRGFVAGAGCLLGGRLHAAILGACLGVPTLGIPWDGRPLGAGSSKTIAIGMTGRPGWLPVYPVRRPEDAMPWAPHGWRHEPAAAYRRLSHETARALPALLGG